MTFPWSFVSASFGWIYTALWSLSFFPQPIFNWRRKTTDGTNIDFPAVNTLGFICYLIYNLAFLYSHTIRAQYAARNGGFTPTVTVNDLAFSIMAVLCTLTTLTQFSSSLWGFRKIDPASHEVLVSTPIKGVVAGCLVAIAVVCFLVLGRGTGGGGASGEWAEIDIVYTLSYVKLAITLIKYSPQIYTNYVNKSTAGWSIEQILLDFGGGILSLLQLFLDSWIQNDWSGVTGNPVKLGLGLISMSYDTVFFVQHYLLYGGRGKKSARAPADADEGSGLLEG